MKKVFNIVIRSCFDLDVIFCPVSASIWKLPANRNVRRVFIFGIRLVEWDIK